MMLVRLIFKLAAAPVLLALTLISALLRMALALSEPILSFVSVLLLLISVYTAVRIDLNAGIAGAVFSVLLSPHGLPRFARRIADKLDDLGYALKGFLLS